MALTSPQGKKGDNPEAALKDFKSIVEAEEEKGTWCFLSLRPPIARADRICHRGFKALKQATKLLYLVLHRPAEALETYKQLLTYTKSAVTRNESEKTINGILDYVGGGKVG